MNQSLHQNDPAGKTATATRDRLQSMSAEQLKEMLKRRAAKKGGSAQTTAAPEVKSDPSDFDPYQPHILSYSQEQLWFQCQLDPENSVWNIPCRLTLTGPLDTGILEQALARVMERHSSLRIAFCDGPDGPRQKAHQNVPVPLQVLDAPTENAAYDWGLEQLATAEAKPLDLSKAPLFRATLVPVGKHEALLGFVFHHIIVDDWSIGLFLRDFSAAYTSLQRDGKADLGIAPHAAEFAQWQREMLQADTSVAHLKHWREMLEDATEPPDVTDFRRPERPTYKAGNSAHTLDRDLSEKVRASAKAMGVSPFALMLSAYSIVLMRFLGCDDITIGTPFANRASPNSEDMMGFFVNSLPLRISQAGQETWTDFACETHRRLLGALENSDVPFSKIVEELNPARDRNRHLLFQHVIAMQDTLIEEFSLCGEDDTTSAPLKASPHVMGPEKCLLDLRLYVWRTLDGYNLTLNFAAELYDADTCAQLLKALETVLVQSVAQPSVALAKLKLLPSGADCAPAAIHPAETDLELDVQDISARFDVLVLENPAAVALHDELGDLTFAALQTAANHLAENLHAMLGQETGTVGLFMGRGRAYALGVLACLKAGIPFVPLDPDYPAARLADIVKQAQVAICLKDSAHSIPDTVWTAQTLDISAFLSGELELAAKDLAGPVFDPPHDMEATAYILFTSGTTGTPKGVEISRRAWASYLAAFSARHDIGSSDRILQRAPISFDASLWEFGMLFWAGAALRIIDDTDARDPRALLQHAQGWGVTQLRVTPALLTMLVDESRANSEQSGLHHLSDLRRIITGADRFSTELYSATHSLVPNCEIINAYGPTEATVNCVTTSLTCMPLGRSAPIGRPTANNLAVVVDKNLMPVPQGFSGELLISGQGLSKGYLGNATATTESFVHLKWGAEKRRFYRTGDQVRQDTSGDLIFLGRIDDQIKLRGHRIELPEVESALITHTAVQDAAARVIEETLYCWVVCASGHDSITQNELIAHLANKLPSYMIPSQWRKLDEIPRHKSSKIDRQRLTVDLGQQLDRTTSAEGSGKLAEIRSPQNHEEDTILKALTGVLSCPVHDPTISFFDLGVTSLQLVHLRKELETALKRPVPLAAFFEHRTTAQLALYLRAQEAEPSESDISAVNADQILAERRKLKRKNRKAQLRKKRTGSG